MTNYDQSDIRWIASEWERIVRDIHYPNRKLAMKVLWQFSAIYFRGKGKRIGSYSGLKKYSPQISDLARAVCEHVFTTPHKETRYASLNRLNLSTMEGMMDFFKSRIESGD